MSAEKIDVKLLQASAEEASSLLKTLANRDRMLLLCQMTQGEFSVGELQQMTGIQQPTLSQQLTVLREKELVQTRRDGKQIRYRIASENALAIIQMLYKLYCPQEAT